MKKYCRSVPGPVRRGQDGSSPNVRQDGSSPNVRQNGSSPNVRLNGSDG